MREIVLELAGKRGRAKEGAAAERLTLRRAANIAATQTAGAEFVAVDEAIGQLAAKDGRAAELVRLRFYGGMNMLEMSMLLERPQGAVKREWEAAVGRVAELKKV